MPLHVRYDSRERGSGVASEGQIVGCHGRGTVVAKGVGQGGEVVLVRGNSQGTRDVFLPEGARAFYGSTLVCEGSICDGISLVA